MGTSSASARVSLKRVLFATDFSLSSEIALSHALAIARRYRSKIYVAHVIPPELYKSVPQEILEEAIEKTREHAQHEMSYLVRSGGLRKITPPDHTRGRGHLGRFVASGSGTCH